MSLLYSDLSVVAFHLLAIPERFSQPQTGKFWSIFIRKFPTI